MLLIGGFYVPQVNIDAMVNRCATLLLIMCLVSGCAPPKYRFERFEGDRTIEMPLAFDGFTGIRDGALVQAEARFVNGADVVTMDITIFLRPPAEFQSGTYQATISGQTSSGNVECPSLNFQGGQTAVPAVGGVFILKDDQNRPLYRVTIPAMTLTRGAR